MECSSAKIVDGTFRVINSSKAVELQDKATLTREEMGEIIGQITTEWDFDTAKSLAESNLTVASAADKGDVLSWLQMMVPPVLLLMHLQPIAMLPVMSLPVRMLKRLQYST